MCETRNLGRALESTAALIIATFVDARFDEHFAFDGSAFPEARHELDVLEIHQAALVAQWLDCYFCDALDTMTEHGWRWGG